MTYLNENDIQVKQVLGSSSCVSQLDNKNQYVINIPCLGWLFQSYDSIIALWDRTQRKLIINENYWHSKTTQKHLYLFIKYYTPLNISNSKELENAIKNDVIIINNN